MGTDCTHDLHLLTGVADGIVCSGCGRKFETMDAVLADRKPEEKPKRTRKKKGEGDNVA